jgi:hypothetical protein
VRVFSPRRPVKLLGFAVSRWRFAVGGWPLAVPRIKRHAVVLCARGGGTNGTYATNGTYELPNGQLQTANCQPPTLSPHFKPLGHDGLDSESFGLEFSVADGR